MFRMTIHHLFLLFSTAHDHHVKLFPHGSHDPHLFLFFRMVPLHIPQAPNGFQVPNDPVDPAEYCMFLMSLTSPFFYVIFHFPPAWSHCPWRTLTTGAVMIAPSSWPILLLIFPMFPMNKILLMSHLTHIFLRFLEFFHGLLVLPDPSCSPADKHCDDPRASTGSPPL